MGSASPGPIELLAPARDLAAGRVAILCGADAIYVGGPRFGARAGAGNPLEAVAELAAFAHVYRARVYLALNTLLTDAELPDAVALIRRAWESGIDGVIVQDYGLLECDLPPVPLIASTQTDNCAPDKVAFLERAGFARVILARELSLGEIREIRARSAVELECFVHGSLCVSWSGRCYLSLALGGRSGNRGECAQPCRRPYSLVDAHGRCLARDRHLLSLGDLNLAGRLGDLLDAGVTAFKIEGRLKDADYVKNVVAHYRRALDTAMAPRGLCRTSLGDSTWDFQPDPERTFHRPFTEWYLDGLRSGCASLATPKSIGRSAGRVVARRDRTLRVEGDEPLRAGDGIAFLDGAGRLRGTAVERVDPDGNVTVGDARGLRVGTALHRNLDREFTKRLARARIERRMAIDLGARRAGADLQLWARDPEGIEVDLRVPVVPWEPARDPDAMRALFEGQLARLGGTEFRAADVRVALDPIPFLPAGRLAAWRRDLVTRLREARARARVCPCAVRVRTGHPYPATRLGFEANALNAAARAFYRRHGVELTEPAAESGAVDLRGRRVMTSRYCLLRELGRCLREPAGGALAQPLALVDAEGRRFPLRFLCGRCEMEVMFGEGA